MPGVTVLLGSVYRLETLACQIESHSPELSRAQTNMREELQQFERRVNRIAIPILQVCMYVVRCTGECWCYFFVVSECRQR